MISIGGGSTAILVEESSDSTADIWNADCSNLDDDFCDHQLHRSGSAADTQSLTTLHIAGSNSSSSTSDIGHHVCTVLAGVEVHSDPVEHQGPDSNSSSLTTASLMYTPSQSGDCSTVCISSTDTTSATSHLNCNNLPNSLSAQEIVDLIRSEGFVLDMATVLRCGSSQSSLFTGHESRGHQHTCHGGLINT